MYAPEVNFSDISNLDVFLENAQKLSKLHHSIFLRLEILNENDTEIVAKLKEKKFIKSFEELQPEYRQIIAIDKSEEEILAQMKEKGRYNIKVAQRHGIEIHPSANINAFYSLFAQTARRDKFQIRPKSYFEALLDKLSADGYAELLEAKYHGEVIAAEIVTYFDETASYLYGASSNENREVMAPYLLHLEAMRRAKERGMKFYDLLAVAPEGEDGHKYAGISRFKRQFGGRTVQIVGGYDLVFRPTWYKIFKFVEKMRRH